MTDAFQEFEKSSAVFKFVTTPSNMLGWGVGVAFRAAAYPFGRRARSPEPTAGTVLPILSSSGVLAAGAMTNIIFPVALFHVAASVVVDFCTDFKAFRAGVRDGAGYTVVSPRF